jgi:hypothetical protein
LLNKVFIHEQVGISKEKTIDAANSTFDETKIVLKNITCPYVFVENEQWSVVCMKKDFIRDLQPFCKSFTNKKSWHTLAIGLPLLLTWPIDDNL